MPYRRPRASTNRNRRGRNGLPKRQFVWVRTVAVNIPQIATSWPVDLLPSNAIDPGAVVGSTVTRVRGSVAITGAAPTDTLASVAAGLVVANRNWIALDPGPDPFDEGTVADWLYWENKYLATPNFSTYSNTAPVTSLTAAFDFDAKAQRRISEPLDTLWMTLRPIVWTPLPTALNLTASVLLKLG